MVGIFPAFLAMLLNPNLAEIKLSKETGIPIISLGD
jgi:hypothetical protein